MNAPPPPPPPPGARLYLPNYLFSNLQPTYHAGTDLPNGSPLLHYTFPFDAPDPMLENSQLKLHGLSKAALSTGTAQTATATQIEQLRWSPHALRRVQMSPTFLDNLMKYADHREQYKLRFIGDNNQAQAAPPAINTWTLPHYNIRFPNGEEQAIGIKAIASWYLAYVNRGPSIPEMNSEPSVQGEVLHGIIEPMNALLKVNFVATEVSPALSTFQTRYPPHANNNFYPLWSRSCSALHNTPGNNNNAGYPDFILLRSTARGDNAAVAEIKTWWAYPDSVFREIFNPEMYPNNEFDPDAANASSKLLKQLWGQLHYFNCQLGFCSNGRTIMFFASPDQNTLVVSQRMNWEDPRVHQAMVGLTFAAVDIKHLNRIRCPFIDSYLCPWAGRRMTW